MFKKSLWGIALTLVATAGLLLTPDISQAQRRGGGGGRGGSWGRGGGGWGRGGGGYYGGGWNRGWGGYGLGFGLGYGLGYYGGYPYDGGYDGYYGSPYYSSSDYYAPSYSYETPPTYYQQPGYVAPQAGYYGAASQQPANPNAAELTVSVPDPNAEIWVENHKTQQRGTVREFESASLQPGQNYTFHIRARWNNNGQMVEQTRTVQAQAGQQVVVNFNTNIPSAPVTNQGATTQVPAPQ